MCSVDNFIRTRFAPSPTGMLHIGGARTALFNWLYAKKNNGKFFLRIEDTDKKRYCDESFNSIIEGLNWLGLEFDEDLYMQSLHVAEHLKVANVMKDSGFAYFSKSENVIRLKIPDNTFISFSDTVYGKVEVHSSQIEDTVLVRSDGSPTFILSMAVDDYQMQITDVIRGSDHITNTLKQVLIFKSMGWKLPQFTHIPLIHNEKGEKLSKRDGALSVLEYKHMGFLATALKNYLLRLGWGHQNYEIIDDKLAIDVFTLEGIRPSPACFDMSKLEHLNHYYINSMDESALILLVIPFVEEIINRALQNEEIEILQRGISIFKPRASTLKKLAQDLKFYFFPPKFQDMSEEHIVLIQKIPINEIILEFEKIEIWDKNSIELCIKNFAKLCSIAVKDIYIALRLFVVGVLDSPSISLILCSIDKGKLTHRIRNFSKDINSIKNMKSTKNL